MVRRLNTSDQDFDKHYRSFLDANRASDSNVQTIVRDIIEEVRTHGDDALVRLTGKFDRYDAASISLRLSDREIDDAVQQVSSKTMTALKFAADRIRAFHERQKPQDIDYIDGSGTRLGQYWTGLEAVGLYVPGGLASYPSSVLMNAVPAAVANVNRIAMAVPTPDGILNPAVIAAAKIAGVTEIYRVGGAQAVAALAFGTHSIAPVDKIVGPGNAYVAEAKRQVFGRVGIDTIAGPSEIFVISDDKSRPDWIAADLLSQAEHDTSAQSILATPYKAFADQVSDWIETHLKTLPKADIARQSWQDNGCIILTRSLEEAVELANRHAPEHLEIATDNASDLMKKIRHAGAVFLGRYTPEAIGDYVAGPNHVLPTSRAARFSSGLSVYDFMKRTSFVNCTEASLKSIGPSAVHLAETEGLQAHALSVALRLSDI